MPINAKEKLERIIEELENNANSALSKIELEKIIINKAGVISNLGKKSYIDSLISLGVIKKGYSGNFVNLKFKTKEESLKGKKEGLKMVEARIKKMKKEIAELEKEKK
jgi:hypothetical protein